MTEQDARRLAHKIAERLFTSGGGSYSQTADHLRLFAKETLLSAWARKPAEDAIVRVLMEHNAKKGGSDG